MATNRDSIVELFEKYYGRKPREGDAAEGGYTDTATIDWLTQFSPPEVEQKLADDSPITGGRLWSDYQKNPGSPPNEFESVAQELAAEFNLTDSEAKLLGVLGQEKYKTTNLDISDEEMSNLLSGAATDAWTQAKADGDFGVDSSFNKIKYDEINALKTQMGDLRNASARYAQQEKLSYSEKLRTTKNALAANGATFSGQTRLLLGNQAAQGANDFGQEAVEGTMPQQRRYDIEDTNANIQETARDIGQAAENRFGSRAISDIQSEFGQFSNPYKNTADGNLDYDGNAKSDLYNARKMKEDGTGPQDGYVLSNGQSNLINDKTSGKDARFYATYTNEKNAAKERAARLNEATRANYTKR